MKIKKRRYSAVAFHHHLNKELQGDNRLKYLLELDQELVTDLLKTQFFIAEEQEQKRAPNGLKYNYYVVELHATVNNFYLTYIAFGTHFDYSLSKLEVAPKLVANKKNLELTPALYELFSNYDFEEEKKILYSTEIP